VAAPARYGFGRPTEPATREHDRPWPEARRHPCCPDRLRRPPRVWQPPRRGRVRHLSLAADVQAPPESRAGRHVCRPHLPRPGHTRRIPHRATHRRGLRPHRQQAASRLGIPTPCGAGTTGVSPQRSEPPQERPALVESPRGPSPMTRMIHLVTDGPRVLTPRATTYGPRPKPQPVPRPSLRLRPPVFGHERLRRLEWLAGWVTPSDGPFTNVLSGL